MKENLVRMSGVDPRARGTQMCECQNDTLTVAKLTDKDASAANRGIHS